jgi:hypothetical protein
MKKYIVRRAVSSSLIAHRSSLIAEQDWAYGKCRLQKNHWVAESSVGNRKRLVFKVPAQIREEWSHRMSIYSCLMFYSSSLIIAASTKNCRAISEIQTNDGIFAERPRNDLSWQFQYWHDFQLPSITSAEDKKHSVINVNPQKCT